MSITAEKVEQIARIIEPTAWRFESYDSPEGRMAWSAGSLSRTEALAKAEAILSLLQQGEPEGWRYIADEALRKYAKSLRVSEAKLPGSTYGMLKPEAVEEAADCLKNSFLSASPLPPAPGAETGESLDIIFERLKREASNLGYVLVREPDEPDSPHSSSRQAALEEADYFASLVSRARAAATKATTKFPQPNYVTLKIAEEAGEVVRGCVHYAEKRMDWSEVEGEIVQLLAMLIRLVTEGDQVNGVIPPLATTPPAEGETK